jgi:glutathione S-transferase
MRARCALIYADIDFEIREIDLRAKPLSMQKLSPKATVPVLLTNQQQVIDQSLDIMNWALAQHDPEHWLFEKGTTNHQITHEWIGINDGPFKQLLDQYKYPNRYPEQSQEQVLELALNMYLVPLNDRLKHQQFLLGNQISMLDIALFPFVRQFMGVDSKKFQQLPLKELSEWLNFFILSDLFNKVMAKYLIWREIET